MVRKRLELDSHNLRISKVVHVVLFDKTNGPMSK